MGTRRNALGMTGAAGLLVAAAFAAGGSAGADTTATVQFDYTGAEQTWVVPAGVTEITVVAAGAQGGDNADDGCFDFGGPGGRVTATIAVTPGQTITVVVGGHGGDSDPTDQGVGGYNGGADAGVPDTGFNIYAAGGGGASDIRIGGATLADRVVVAGGGGGVGAACTGAGDGGDGGGATGGAGSDGSGGQGGTGSAGGTGDPNGLDGTLGVGGAGGAGNPSEPRPGGGGGGGFYGGGGGTNAATSNDNTSSGGGGSSLCPQTCVLDQAGVNQGDGGVSITYTISTGSTTTTAPSGAVAATGVSTDPAFTG